MIRLRWSERGYDYIPNRGLKEVDDFFVLLIVCVAGHVKSGCTRSMLGELHKLDDQALSSWPDMVPTSCAQSSAFGAPWLIQYSFTGIQERKERKLANGQIHIL
jgi:hypothetical protein